MTLSSFMERTKEKILRGVKENINPPFSYAGPLPKAFGIKGSAQENNGLIFQTLLIFLLISLKFIILLLLILDFSQ